MPRPGRILTYAVGALGQTLDDLAAVALNDLFKGIRAAGGGGNRDGEEEALVILRVRYALGDGELARDDQHGKVMVITRNDRRTILDDTELREIRRTKEYLHLKIRVYQWCKRILSAIACRICCPRYKREPT